MVGQRREKRSAATVRAMSSTSARPGRPSAGGAWGSAASGGRVAWGAAERVDPVTEPERLDAGLWFVVADFEGRARAWRFEHSVLEDARARSEPGDRRTWRGPWAGDWSSSMSREEYCAAVEEVRARILDGDVYQANVCRILTAPLPTGAGRLDPQDAEALAALLAAGNPAPYAARVAVVAPEPDDAVWVVSASPELYLRVEGGTITSAPIKGTALTAAGLLEKDRAENIMITDLVRNDLQQVCVPGSIEVPHLLEVEEHPGLVHLVSTVRGALLPDLVAGPRRWQRMLAATFPPGSVSGAPKESALSLISRLERAPRGPYCGAVGWIDADAGTAELAVGIRTFWSEKDGAGVPVLRFGTGAGITWESDPAAEWEETELKARRLVGLASRAAARSHRPDGRLGA